MVVRAMLREGTLSEKASELTQAKYAPNRMKTILWEGEAGVNWNYGLILNVTHE